MTCIYVCGQIYNKSIASTIDIFICCLVMMRVNLDLYESEFKSQFAIMIKLIFTLVVMHNNNNSTNFKNVGLQNM